MTTPEAKPAKNRLNLALLLRVLGSIAASLFPLPLMLFVLAVLPGTLSLSAPYWILVLIGIIAGFTHLFWTAWIKRITKSRDLSKSRQIILRAAELLAGLVISTVGTLLLVALASLEPGLDTIFTLIIQFLLILISWQVVGKANEGAYYDTYHDSFIIAFSTLALVAYIIAAIRQVTLPDGGLAYAFIYIVGIWAVLRNQGNIDAQMSRGRHNFDELPARIRRTNMLMVLGFVVLFALLYTFRAPLIALIENTLIMIRNLIGAILRFVLRGEDPEPIPPEVVPEPGPSDNGLGALPTAEGSSWWNLLYLIVGGAMIAALIFYRKDIAYSLREKWRQFKAFLRRVFNLRVSEESDLSGSRFYDDTIVALEPDDLGTRRRRRLFNRNPARVLKRQAGKLSDTLSQRDTDAEGRVALTSTDVRETYRLLLVWLKLNGYAQLPSQTPRQILKNSDPHLGDTSFDIITDIYEDVRYASENKKDEPLRLPAERAHQLIGFLDGLRRS